MAHGPRFSIAIVMPIVVSAGKAAWQVSGAVFGGSRSLWVFTHGIRIDDRSRTVRVALLSIEVEKPMGIRCEKLQSIELCRRSFQ